MENEEKLQEELIDLLIEVRDFPNDYMAEHLIKNDIIIQKHGEWQINGASNYVCSACGEYSCCTAPYCPDCGAKMKNNYKEAL